MKFYFIFFLETIFDRKRIKNMIKKVDILGGRDTEFGIDMNKCCILFYFFHFFQFYLFIYFYFTVLYWFCLTWT